MRLDALATLTQHGTPLPAADAVARPGTAEWISVDRASFGIEWVDQSLVAEGAGYHATFDRGSFRFLPALGRAAPANRPVTLTVETIARGEHVVYRASGSALPSQPTRDADRPVVSWNRDGIRERFEATADGIEHSFLFAKQPAGTGDLVVRLRVDTDLIADTGRDLQSLRLLEPGIGGVTIGAVTGIDALGMRSPGSMHYDGRHLELVLPARFVDAAAYPMVLDPLVGSSLHVANPADNDIAPDCAYDSGTDRYLIVWHRNFSNADTVVRGRLMQANGVFTGPAFLTITDQGGSLEANPKVANINANDCFVVAWTQNASAGAPRDIACRLVRADQATLGAILVVATGASDQVDPDVGGEATTLNNDVMIVFRDATAGIIELRQVDFDRTSGVGTLGAQMLVAGPDAGISRPAIAKSGGAGRKYLVAWDAGGPYLGVRIVNHNATPWTGGGLISGAEPEKIDVDGDGSRWTVVWNELEPGQPVGGNRNVWAITAVAPAASTTSPALAVSGSKRTVAANAQDDEAEPAVAFYGDATTSTSTVTWYDATARPASVLSGTNIQRDTNLRSGNPFAVGPASGYQVRWPNFATKLSGGATSYEGLLVFWANELATLNGDVYVQRHRVHQGGAYQTIANGCSGGGQLSLDFALALGRRTNISLQQADPSVILGYLLVGIPNQSPMTCLPCTMITNALTAGVSVTAGTAGYALFVPGSVSYAGMNLDMQFAVISPQIQSCAQVPGVATSNVVRANISD
ncbi:MAG: hypothetical protein IPK26_14805 [Planctomycetes bacterium]|nr:hypothetical protein [Planctomycetota bacterium]